MRLGLILLLSRIWAARHWKRLVRFVAWDQLFRVTKDHLFTLEVVARLFLQHIRKKAFRVAFLMIYWFWLVLFGVSSKLGRTLLIVGIWERISDLLVYRSHQVLLIVITLMIIPMVVFILGPRPQIMILILTRQRMIILALIDSILHLPYIFLRSLRVSFIGAVGIIVVLPKLLISAILLILNLKVLEFVLDNTRIPLYQVYNPGQQNRSAFVYSRQILQHQNKDERLKFLKRLQIQIIWKFTKKEEEWSLPLV